jgi:hypothetical protein
MPVTATPMINAAAMVEPRPRTRSPAHNAAVPATIAISTDTPTRPVS